MNRGFGLNVSKGKIKEREMELMKSKIEQAVELMNEDFRVFSTLVLKQFDLLEKICQAKDGLRDEKMHELDMNEKVLDGLEVKMREEIVRSIVLYGPRASDLRKIMAYHDMSSYLERMGDLAKNIAEYAVQLKSEAPELVTIRTRLFDLLSVSEKMAQNAIFAFTCEDNLLARDTIAKDNVADDMQAEITRRLIEIPISDLGQSDLRDIVCMSGMAYNMERIADHATNIAESALFLMEGRDWKHLESQVD